MSVLRKLDRCLERFLSIMDGIAAISVFGIMLLITADVLSRLILNKPFAGTAEIVSSIIIIVCFLEIPYVAVKGAHVRTTMLYDKVGVKGKHGSADWRFGVCIYYPGKLGKSVKCNFDS